MTTHILCPLCKSGFMRKHSEIIDDKMPLKMDLCKCTFCGTKLAYERSVRNHLPKMGLCSSCKVDDLWLYDLHDKTLSCKHCRHVVKEVLA